MRRTHLILLVTGIILTTLALRSVSTLLSLLTEDAASDVIHPSELPALNSTLNTTLLLPQLIPKIIHQTYINTSVPERWRLAQESCLALHPDYEYKFWTDERSHAFIAREYPWFLATFDGYGHPIQRADAIRYFVLAHYGGVYLDLDNGCRRRLDPLLTFPAWLHLTKPTGISNDGMGASPRHPFFLHAVDQLQVFDRNWLLPYITIMASTGPLFLSVVWKRYNALHAKEPFDWPGRVRVLTPDDYFLADGAFFDLHYGGSSWHGDDAKFILWMGQHWLLLTVLGFGIGAVVGLAGWWVWGRVFMRRSREGSLATKSAPTSPRMYPRGGPWLLPAWRSWTWRRRKGRNGRYDYELAEQHDT